MMLSVYQQAPTYHGAGVTLRPMRPDDVEALLRCYSDERAVPLFNDDNCLSGFHMTTLEQMRQAIAMWQTCYQLGDFLRLTVVDDATGEAVGTIEMFHCDSGRDRPLSYGVLRVDLRSDHENQPFLTALLTLCAHELFVAFDVRELVTKAAPIASERRAALTRLGYTPTAFRSYDDYFSLVAPATIA